MPTGVPLSTLLSHTFVAYTIELDNEFEHRFTATDERARVASVVMWSNFLRFVGEGIAVGEVPHATGLPKNRMLSTIGGMERWRYVFVAPEGTTQPPTEKREGWGSARALRADWVVRPTQAGREATKIWPGLFGEIDARWQKRFGAHAVDALRTALRSLATRIDVELPEHVPIVAANDGMAAGVSPVGKTSTSPPRHLAGLLAQVLLAYTLEFERDADLSLPLSANFVRVLDADGVAVRDVPAAAGVSKEATSIALRHLTKTGDVVVEGSTASTKRGRLTAKGLEARERLSHAHVGIEKRWRTRFGDDEISDLRTALETLLGQHAEDELLLSQGLRPYPEGWRAKKPYLEHTEAMIRDPRAGLPHYPMVLHRGGWPDGS